MTEREPRESADNAELVEANDYLLDSNVCINLINRREGRIRERFDQLPASAGTGNAVYVSSIVIFELWYGVFKSARVAYNRAKLMEFFTGPAVPLRFNEDDARVAGEIRAQLERVGTPIGPYDVLIAAQAMNRGLTLVTANRREFGRVPGLRWEDWAEGF